ncbi:NAD(P)/FAD-dependent oxidoreductase [Microbacterium indicum]|uniref:NAD(P)/FAD-dependent oxidoreductase n=1 Tax=Microbacterium indicum TaxID=358100 RepID=UPI000423BBAF|nr:NAD(P)/FAD-dependent oxidoreductase [Microbacterium indicum]
MDTTFDAAVIGAGPAGLQAALTLGRMHRSAVVFDAGTYRNDPTDAAHNLIGHDGQAPAELRAAARADVARYDDVRFVDAEVSRVTGSAGAFALETASGAFSARRVILATGVRDTLPAIPGLADAFGTVVAHCPFCHGHEFAGRAVALIGPGPMLLHMSALMDPIASSVVGYPSAPLTPDEEAALAARGVEISEAPIREIRRAGDGVKVDGRPFGGALVRVESAPAAPHAEQLGLELSDLGLIATDALGRTSEPGVFAAGDAAHQRGLPGPMWQLWSAIATGAAAATATVQSLLA